MVLILQIIYILMLLVHGFVEGNVILQNTVLEDPEEITYGLFGVFCTFKKGIKLYSDFIHEMYNNFLFIAWSLQFSFVTKLYFDKQHTCK